MPGSKEGRAKDVSRRDPVRTALWSAAAALATSALVFREARLAPQLVATATPFGILGAVVAAASGLDRRGLFTGIGRRAASIARSARTSLSTLLVLTAILSAAVNLDVAVVALMPVAMDLAARRGLDRRWTAVAVANTANAGSILLPTSNATNLLLLQRAGIGSAAFLEGSVPVWLAVVSIGIAAFVLATRGMAKDDTPATELAPIRILPALCDLAAMYVGASAIRALIGGMSFRGGFPVQAAEVAGLASAVNNLGVAAALVPHGLSAFWADLLGATVGPNLLLTGSVAAVIGRRIAREHGADLPVLGFSMAGLALAPLQCAAAYGVLHLVGAI